MKFDLSKIELLVAVLKNSLPYFFVFLLCIEVLFFFYSINKYKKKEVFVNIAAGTTGSALQFIVKIYFLANIYPFVYQYRLFDMPIGWYQLITTFFIYTFLQWFIHYLEHKVRILWCLHEVHHSATQMNITTGIRTSVFDIVSMELLFLIIPFFGFHYIFYFLFYTINKIWGSFIHISDKIIGQIPVLKYLLVTPAGHQIHHASNKHYLDKNFGELVPWFDYIFKTYATDNKGTITYGSVRVTGELAFWESQTHEFKALWRDMKSVGRYTDKFLYLIMPPGWHPGNFEGTTAYIQKHFSEEQEEGLIE